MLNFSNKLTLAVLTFLLVLAAVVAVPSKSSAQIQPTDAACEAIGAASGASGDCSDPAGPQVDSTLELVINGFSLVIGIAAVIMIMIGGLKYVMSSGDSNSINGAKNTILYAIIGLVVVALAQIVVKFVLGNTL